MTTTTRNLWEFLEMENRHAPKAQECFSWGLNCNHNSNPWNFFLDLIGWSEDHYGERIVKNPDSLGFMELGYLAEALVEYSDNPYVVTDWVSALMACDES